MNSVKTVLSIAASDCTGGAGLQADIKTLSALGLHCLTAVTAVTCQNSKGLSKIYSLPKGAIKNQLKSIFEEVSPSVIKIGMLGSIENAEELIESWKLFDKNTTVIIDPILSISAGVKSSHLENQIKLIDYYLEIFRLFSVIPTPNYQECKEILKQKDISGEEAVIRLLTDFNLEAAIVTGCDDKIRLDENHYTLSEDYSDNKIYDIIAVKRKNNIQIKKCHKRKIKCINLHGTGCVFSSLFAGYIALGFNLEQSFKKSSKKIHDIISKSIDYRMGTSEYGPLNILQYNFKQ